MCSLGHRGLYSNVLLRCGMPYGVLVTPFTRHAGPDVESRVARGHVAGDVPLPAPMASWLHRGSLLNSRSHNPSES